MTEIGLFGWSMGASTSIIAAAESEFVKVVVADSPFADLQGYLNESFRYWTKLPNYFGTYMSKIISTLFFREFKPSDVKPYISARGVDSPVLLIHSLSDDVISFKQSELLKKELRTVEIWNPDGCGHIRAYKVHTNEYETKLQAFLNKYF